MRNHDEHNRRGMNPADAESNMASPMRVVVREGHRLKTFNGQTKRAVPPPSGGFLASLLFHP